MGQEFVARWPFTLYGSGGHCVIRCRTSLLRRVGQNVRRRMWPLIIVIPATLAPIRAVVIPVGTMPLVSTAAVPPSRAVAKSFVL